MTQRKKLQVFVSSTYTDMREERQAAVEAILTAGHIPAGMELFTAGDQSQMHVIKRWIDESDIFLLILGGRYGSIEPESQKSYVQLEYEYAIKQNKPFFAVIINNNYLEEKVRKIGSNVIETDHAQKLREFRSSALMRLVKFWSSPLEIKLAIYETMAEFSRRDELVGWIPGNEAVNTGALAEEIARLTKENAILREQLEKLSRESIAKENILYHGVTFDEMCNILNSERVDNRIGSNNINILKEIANVFGDEEPSILHLLWGLRKDIFSEENSLDYPGSLEIYANKLIGYGLLRIAINRDRTDNVATFTDEGRKFLMRLMADDKTKGAQSYVMES